MADIGHFLRSRDQFWSFEKFASDFKRFRVPIFPLYKYSLRDRCYRVGTRHRPVGPSLVARILGPAPIGSGALARGPALEPDRVTLRIGE
jgi:hypothetical protein